jgi:hypothetical protein
MSARARRTAAGSEPRDRAILADDSPIAFIVVYAPSLTDWKHQ